MGHGKPEGKNQSREGRSRKMIHRNQEGYKDPTAGKAIENILKEDKNMLDTMKGDILDVYTTDGTIGNPVMVVTR